MHRVVAGVEAKSRFHDHYGPSTDPHPGLSKRPQVTQCVIKGCSFVCLPRVVYPGFVLGELILGSDLHAGKNWSTTTEGDSASLTPSPPIVILCSSLPLLAGDILKTQIIP